MAGRALPAIRGAIEWLIHDQRRWLVTTVGFWLLVFGALIAFGVRVLWLGVALGVLVTVSVWVAWNGPRLRARDHLNYFLLLTPAEVRRCRTLPSAATATYRRSPAPARG